uniref:Uncharacterized protein n=1 Tax=Micrurus corallinus TaxID=54390 RepID=A0A2D4GM53_MICCO
MREASRCCVFFLVRLESSPTKKNAAVAAGIRDKGNVGWRRAQQQQCFSPGLPSLAASCGGRKVKSQPWDDERGVRGGENREIKGQDSERGNGVTCVTGKGRAGSMQD